MFILAITKTPVNVDTIPKLFFYKKEDNCKKAYLQKVKQLKPKYDWKDVNYVIEMIQLDINIPMDYDDDNEKEYELKEQVILNMG